MRQPSQLKRTTAKEKAYATSCISKFENTYIFMIRQKYRFCVGNYSLFQCRWEKKQLKWFGRRMDMDTCKIVSSRFKAT